MSKGFVLFRCCFLLFLGVFIFHSKTHAQERVISTGVPFLLITPDARAAGMGEQGVATSVDAFSQQWNPAKYVFSEQNSAFAISYTPYLSKLVSDIFLANITYYNKNSERSAWATSLKYFSLGEIVLNDLVAGSIIQQGVERPNELTLDFSYSLLLNSKYSMAVAARFIRSDLKLSSDADASSANTLGVDIAGFYRSDLFDFRENKARLRAGFNISNIGPRLKYDEGGQKNFIPTNLKLGTGLNVHLDANNKISFNVEFNKLLVPTPVAFLDEGTGEVLSYQQPDISFLSGIFESFSDAPDGFSEELKEITWGVGSEYNFQDSFALRGGYFNESLEKGSRRYFTLGAGFSLDFAEIDISYLFSTSKVRNPLENTLRFSIIFNLGNPQVEQLED
ncbi:type IX secretion system outer membrane channel protein PorV [Flavobacteriaceae bacterium]|uniref:type IX secretion system outer membrane channel protein PorV n=1 Tax=Candidatus Arcticimaribacter forsetii TaxID=2820661 RepID=UPI0020775D6A|nr:type IX secretion system outer membrane channel protein PorV [Candidatus Arcticimaribacter forsetii]MDA8639464.1 type IX secretion system outer membrane channel protein PorV [Flavobacteriaceae bacterium]MDA8698773.1 type IX secretion system outer membrane channel protein PorV [Flavobacteriaceae bacterium]MDB2325784.1 type IX secretion system outer membrane channel protein PorV [Flavobacteriaceae bacterium]MDB4674710.1 type IX secretion system outer membrane channel protein PorV [Flavobacteri